jgi:regulatory protein
VIRQIDQFKKALEYAFLLLKYRLRSEQELRLRMKRKKFAPETIERAITFLKEKKFIDDAIFAKAWMESRLIRPLGLRRIQQELKLKGVNSAIISACISKAKETYSETDTIKEIARLKLSKLKGVEPRAAKRRVYAYLLRRGFSPDAIYEVINQL